MGKKDTETPRLSAEAIKEMKQKAFAARDAGKDIVIRRE
jgi:hypothetical protein